IRRGAGIYLRRAARGDVDHHDPRVGAHAAGAHHGAADPRGGAAAFPAGKAYSYREIQGCRGQRTGGSRGAESRTGRLHPQSGRVAFRGARPSAIHQFINAPNRQLPAAAPGFTMIELAIVMSIIIILAAMGMAQYRNAHIRAQEAVLKEDLFQMRDAMDQYYADKGKWPTALDALVSEGYIRKLPQDPFTKSAD